jgi:hypothetical protein
MGALDWPYRPAPLLDQLLNKDGSWIPTTGIVTYYDPNYGDGEVDKDVTSLSANGTLSVTDSSRTDNDYWGVHSSGIVAESLDLNTGHYSASFTFADREECGPAQGAATISGVLPITLALVTPPVPPAITFGLPNNGRPTEMFDDHTLRVNVTGYFSQNTKTSKTLSVEATINGVFVTSTAPMPSTAIGEQPLSILIDLKDSNVPRFDDNQKFTMTATINEAGNSGSAKTDVEIPLPVVHVHGILTDCLPDRTPHGAFDYLKRNHPSYAEDDGFPKLTTVYPTLVSFDYPSLNADALYSASQLTGWIHDKVLSQTWAAKVNVIAHSLGGIISRTAIVNFGAGAFINKLILVGSPSEGAAVAPVFTSIWGAPQALVSAMVSTVAFPLTLRTQYDNAVGCLMKGLPVTTEQMLPTYAWWASSKTAAVQNDLTIPINKKNLFLTQVNLGLHVNVSYYAIVASGLQTPTKLWGRFWLVGPFPALLDPAAYGPGDGIVPISSMTASDTGWPIGTGPGFLNVFDDVGAVFHTSYFDQLQAQADIEAILWP